MTTTQKLIQKRAFTVSLGALVTALSASAWALDVKPYTSAQLADLQKAGKPVAVHFHADWCPTCVAQTKSLDVLKADAQLKPVTVLVVDYDKEKDIRKSLKVRSQSTFVIFKGVTEVARSGGETDAAKIKTALVKSL